MTVSALPGRVAQAAAWLAAFLLLALAGCAPVPHKPGSLPPADLPRKEDVAPARASAIDGVWTISTIGKRIRIERGRAWALDPWAHFGVAEVRPGMVVLRDLAPTGPGRFGGQDLPLAGPFEATLNGERVDVGVKTGLLGVAYQLLPVSLDNPAAYRQELARQAEVTPPVAILPPDPPSWRKPKRSARGCGGEAEAPCATVDARRVGKAEKLGCPGKQSYFSTLRGGSCWTCPRDYVRASPTRRMDHPKACRKRNSLLKGPWVRATYQQRAWGCPPGQFHMAKGGGSCMSCPAGFERIHAAGADTGKCRAKEPCDAGMRMAKQPPEGNLFASLLGFRSTKLCAPPFDIRAAARRDVGRYEFMGKAMQQLATALINDVRAGRTRNVKVLFKTGRWREAYAYLRGLDAFQAFQTAARAAGNRSISIGFGGDVQIGVGGNGEIGLAIDFTQGRIKPYEAGGISKGLALGIDAAVTVGAWKGGFESGYAQGFTTSLSVLGGAGLGVWYSYYDPDDGPERLLGATASVGVGVGAEIGEYNEVGTWLLKDLIESL
ncbi:MAG: hypothetical protein KDH20_00445 [Rhodocyclaceae bacterium]|nr:hypothetical protein [Rhodocyclaceae bacterium]